MKLTTYSLHKISSQNKETLLLLLSVQLKNFNDLILEDEFIPGFTFLFVEKSIEIISRYILQLNTIKKKRRKLFQNIQYC